MTAITKFFLISFSFLTTNLFAQISKSDSIELAKYFEEQSKYWDSLCIAETKRAEIDIKNKKLVHTYLAGMVDTYRSDKEMDSLLAKYSISTEIQGIYCTVPSEKQNCYGNEMEREISKRFGAKFIDSLRQIAEITFVNKHRNEIFRFEDCDMVSRYPGTNDYSEFLENYQRDFFATFKYPEKFQYKNEKYYSYSNVYFTLWKDGKISNLEIESTFQNKENEKFRAEIERQIENFVLKTKWKPATLIQIPVNSEMRLLFHYK